MDRVRASMDLSLLIRISIEERLNLLVYYYLKGIS
jgi:hypothetical protein